MCYTTIIQLQLYTTDNEMRCFFLSISVHVNGHTKSDIRKGIRQHQERNDEKEGIVASNNSASSISPADSNMNVQFIKSDENRLDEIKEKLNVINEKRVQQGQRKLRKDANVFLTGTIQLSDETLQKLGWRIDKNEDGSKKYGVRQQHPQAVKNVKIIYSQLVKSVVEQKDVFGDVFSATLHFDESTPHIDFMSDVLDVNFTDQTARTFVNGPKGTPRGAKLKAMQDKIVEGAHFRSEHVEKFDLRRGDSESLKVDKAKRLRVSEKELEEREVSLKRRSADLDSRETSLDEREGLLDEREDKIKARAERATKTNLNAIKLKMELEEREKKVAEREKVAEERERRSEELMREARDYMRQAEDIAETGGYEVAGYLLASIALERGFASEDVFNAVIRESGLSDKNANAMGLGKSQFTADLQEKYLRETFEERKQKRVVESVQNADFDWGIDDIAPNYSRPQRLNKTQEKQDDLEF